ncbi:MAG TPA: hypothetical protein VFC44_14310, partial [Candidatus Saccharimonadales bacterium]|nr:hypothetical protein [Candidatus Saccharimonadales bacterium]
MKSIRIALFLAASAAPALAQSNAPPPTAGSEVPIREVILSDGTRRYTIPIKVGAKSIDAGLDTGSTGLRILPGVLAPSDATSNGDYDRYSYGAGTEFRGRIGTGTLTIGILAAPSTMELIDTKDCTREVPNCPASRIPMEQFGIQGSGLPGEGFHAIIGVNMAEAEIASPLSAIGARSWIVELPRPGQDTPGRLILNPSDNETKDYARLPILSAFAQQKGGMHDAVMGCIINTADKAKACGPVLMDTGAPGIRLTNGPLGRTPWPNGTQAALTLFDGAQARAIELFTVG